MNAFQKTFLILLVEDEPAHAEIVRRILDDCLVAYKVVHVTDGEAALDYVFHRGRWSDPNDSPRPDLVLLDLRLPKVDGLAVLSEIKAAPAISSIPVVMLTSSDAESEVVKCYESGAASYLIKSMEYELSLIHI